MLTLNPRAGITEYNGAVQNYNNRSLSPFLRKNRYLMMHCTENEEDTNDDLKRNLESLRDSNIQI